MQAGPNSTSRTTSERTTSPDPMRAAPMPPRHERTELEVWIDIQNEQRGPWSVCRNCDRTLNLRDRRSGYCSDACEMGLEPEKTDADLHDEMAEAGLIYADGEPIPTDDAEGRDS